MKITKFCFLDGRKYYHPIGGILLIGIVIGLFLVININNFQVIQVSSYENKSQKGKSAFVSSKTTSIVESLNGHDYLLIEEYKTWIEAKIDCKSRGGHLVTISSQEENDFVMNLIKSDSVWIGFTDESIEGSWQWVTGESVTYTNWSQDEPNDDSGEENYAEMDSSGYWNDIGGQVDSSYLLYYIYEYEPVDHTFLIIGLAIIAILPEFYIFRKLKKFVKYLLIEEGVETP